uniref:Uncharacterized protein n=1 Tax=Anguilla anguilla TaxID=7936 RepID=A0A0E9THW4_ANGAN
MGCLSLNGVKLMALWCFFKINATIVGKDIFWTVYSVIAYFFLKLIKLIIMWRILVLWFYSL